MSQRRGLDPDDGERDAALRPLGDSLKGVVSSLRAPVAGPAANRASGPSASALGGLFRGWDDAVGAGVAAHARPVVLDNGRLVVEVDEPGWATQLRYLERDLLDRVRPLVAPAPLTSLDVRVKGARNPRGKAGRRGPS